jgi:hypothetical protein
LSLKPPIHISGYENIAGEFRRVPPAPQHGNIESGNEKAAPATGAASSSRENSSNGGFKFRQNFLPKSYEPKNGGVKRFFLNKCLCFQLFTKRVNILEECSKMRQIALVEIVSRYF